jgi:glycosyltransferase involved in cell wall biosynthesis
MTNKPLRVSIVITCYNYVRYVASAIDAALGQTYSGVEVIVVDDGSTDGSTDVIRAYESRLHSIRQPNQGSIPAYNRGYAESTGDLVMFLDADDLLAPTAVSECVAAWKSGAVKVQFDLAIIDASGYALGRRFCNFLAAYDATEVRSSFMRTGTYRWPVTVGNAYARTYLQIMMPLQIAHGPDGFLNTIAPVYGEVITIPRCLGSYRLHGSSLWSSNGSDLDRLPERIEHRLSEVHSMTEHAAKHGMRLASVNVLDHELVFINYRLMSLLLGQSYSGSGTDTPLSLWRLGMAFLRTEALPWYVKLTHAGWLSVVSIAPRPLAKFLITLRFNRARYIQPVRRTIQRFFGIIGYRRHGA